MKLGNRLMLAALFCLLPAALWAQGGRATLVGEITDPAGAVVPGASLTLRNVETGREHLSKSSNEGAYTLSELPPGTYSFRLEAPGFRTVQQTGIVMEADQTRRLNLRLEIGETTQVVTVEAEVPVINTETSSRGEVIVQRQVEQLPLNGRDFTDLALLVPGVYRRPAEDDQGGGISTNGMRTDSANFLLDGTTNRGDRNGSVGVNTSPDSIREFSVSTSTYSAEYGRTAGAQINVVTKSGTNKIHGSLFEYLRNDVFDANNFFTVPGTSKALRRNQFGGSLGGPVIKNRMFYFGSYEGTRERRSVSSFNTAPNEAWLRGDFRNVRGPGRDGVLGNADDENRVVDPFTKQEFPTPNVIPQSSWSPVTRQMVSYLPAANIAGTLDRYAAQGNLSRDRDQYAGKLDHRVSDKNNFYARYARQWTVTFDPFPSDRNFYPGFGRDADTLYNSIAFSDTHVFTPNLVTEVRYGRYWQNNRNLGENRDKDWNANFGIPGLNVDQAYQGWPAIRIDGFSEFGDRPNDPFIYDITNHQLVSATTWTFGKHTMKFGYDGIRSAYSEADVRNIRGDFRFRGRNTNPNSAASAGFRSFADFLLGLPDATQRQVGAEAAQLTGWQHALFLQHDWRPTSRLTVNLGLRYELQTPLSEANNRIANFIPGTGQVVLAGTAGYPDSLVSTDRNNLGPRIGFAYRPFGHNRTVIRTGGGIYYSLETFNVIRQQLAVTYPFVQREQFSRVSNNIGLLTMSNPFPESRRGLQGVDTPFGLQQNWQTPTIYMYNFTIEQELLSDLALEVGYVGSQGRYLGRRYNLNQPMPTGQINNGVPVTVRPYPQFGDIQYQDLSATSTYNALQTSLRRRMKGGLTLLASYTFSRALDTTSSTNVSTTGAQKFPQDISNWNLERGLSDFHRAHQFSASFNYDLPFGRNLTRGFARALVTDWRVNGIITALSGRPFTPRYNAPDVSDQRPDIIGNPLANIPAGLRFNPAAFRDPEPTADDPTFFGNAGRNIMIGPNFTSADLSLHRTFRITEGMRLQFRAEAFNTLNHPNFQVPVFLLDRSDVGNVTSTANEGRELQFALRLSF
jgi:hypothetical protein